MGILASAGNPQIHLQHRGGHRGGLAIVREFRLLGDSAVLNVRSDKRRFPPYGLRGGATGSPSMNLVNPGGPEERVLPVLVYDPVTLRRGDVFRLTMSSGGGYGSATERAPGLVLEDVVLDKVSREQARTVYGVVVTDEDGRQAVDAAETAALRKRMAQP